MHIDTAGGQNFLLFFSNAEIAHFPFRMQQLVKKYPHVLQTTPVHNCTVQQTIINILC
jgi:hypothetical protein